MSSTATSSATASATSSAAPTLQASANLKPVGIVLAVTSGVLIGSSFVFKKKGLLKTQVGGAAGEGVGYLKSALWWTGMTMMILGELCNFAAYAFVEALVVTPLGALSVVVCAILSSIFLKETLSFFGWLGCGLCIIGSVIIALNGPHEASVGQIREFQKLFLAPGFLVFSSVLVVASLIIIFYFAPRYGKKSMLWYIFVCSMIGGISVSVTTGLGAAIVTTAMGDSQFKYWFIYFLMVFVVVTLVTEVYYLNVALALFNTAMVTPTYYVLFTFFSMVTTVILFQGLKATVTQIITIVMGFLVICCGITILQMSKIDPSELKSLDRRSTLLLQAAKKPTEGFEEKELSSVEEPGIDSVRGSFGPLGSMIRARTLRRMSQSSREGSTIRSRNVPFTPRQAGRQCDGLTRHQLYDAPVPSLNLEGASDRSSVLTSPGASSAPLHTPTIKFTSEDMVHKYSPAGAGERTAVHARREASHLGHAYAPPSPPLQPIVESSTDGVLLEHPLPQRTHLMPSTIDDLEAGGPRSAPAPVSAFRSERVDPFEDAPATAGPSFAARQRDGGRESPAKMRSHFSAFDDEEQKAWRRQSRHGRLPSERGYPRTGGEDDKEESIGLVQTPPSGGDDDDDDELQPGSIRLVGQSRGHL